MTNTISAIDELHYKLIRSNVSAFLREGAVAYDQAGSVLLDIAPQIHEGARHYFKLAKVLTLDIDPTTKPDFVADITQVNAGLLPENLFDTVVCTEVLEHTRNPFAAVDEIYRITKPQGHVLISAPFNFRIHGPLPDCWRFSIHGLRELLRNFKIIKIAELETSDRWLMPIHYTALAEKP